MNFILRLESERSMISNNSGKLKYELAVYFATTITLTWLFWLIASILKYDVFITVGIFVPSMSGLLLAYVFGNKSEVFSMLKSIINFNIHGKWLPFVFLFLPGVSAVSTLIYYMTGNVLPKMEFPPLFIPVVFVYILVFMGPLGEEIGWRGFALKRMLKCLSPIKSAIFMGGIWATWHLPLFFIEGTTQNILTDFGIIPALLGYSIFTIMISILITLLYTVSNGSILGSILLHTTSNLSLGIVPLIFMKKGAIIILLVLCFSTALMVIKNLKYLITKN
ncbi:MAG: CPBP family intramembrane metalloprotease [Clostridiales bacterium]|nr:CPBP family intramembrane metalloprotease [Clostridiales bacterium]